MHKEKAKSAQYAIECCKEDLCNNQTVWPTLPPVPVFDDYGDEYDDGQGGVLTHPSDGSKKTEKWWVIFVAVSVPILVMFIVLCSVLAFMHRRHKKVMAGLGQPGQFEGAAGDELMALRPQAVGASTLREEYNVQCFTSGSGSGLPQLARRTFAREIALGECIGKGRYGQVHRATYQGDDVAVKIFLTSAEASFEREREIFNITLLRHENILNYVGSDFISVKSSTQLWLVTNFLRLGSLYDYLNRQPAYTFDSRVAHRLIVTALNGLLHLHTSIKGTQGKPAIAHRDIKSKNILVREDGACVIADFGLAVTRENDVLTIPQEGSKVGTKRYMSPEVLDGRYLMRMRMPFKALAPIYNALFQHCPQDDVRGVLPVRHLLLLSGHVGGPQAHGHSAVGTAHARVRAALPRQGRSGPRLRGGGRSCLPAEVCQAGG